MLQTRSFARTYLRLLLRERRRPRARRLLFLLRLRSCLVSARLSRIGGGLGCDAQDNARRWDRLHTGGVTANGGASGFNTLRKLGIEGLKSL